jgi:hypothetical protein
VRYDEHRYLHCFLYSRVSIRAPLGDIHENQGMTRIKYFHAWEILNLVQEVLELNSNSTGMIPDDYRAAAIDGIIGLRDVLSW